MQWVELDTTLDAHELLGLCQQLEQQASEFVLRHWGEQLRCGCAAYGDEK